ncbi:uncharacterized protein LOC135462716 isoform X2 [Liolophura sinensis]|uniref:uncharacterized protein LOC135462716 isoform X2 n=1 Tax=Liolophura sinensis TaxID=3198878 RepID=UPI003158B1BA
MKPVASQSVGIVLLVLFSTCYSAPVLSKTAGKTEALRQVQDDAKQINEQERELESLVQGTNLGDNVKVEEHHHVTYENINGKEQEVQETEKAVIDENNGELVSDVKQEVTQTEGADGKPETHVETKIDIPSKGIHESFSEDGNNDVVNDDRFPNAGMTEEDVDESIVTPQALAEYLWGTQDFGKFRSALQDIVDSKIMTPDEAQGFYQDVVMEYDKLRQLNSLYPYQSEDEETFLSPLVGGPQYSNIIPGVPADEITIPIDSLAQKRVPQIPFYGEEYPSLSDYELEQQREAYELNAALQRQAVVDETIKGLLEEWFATAVESGDTDSAKLVSDLAAYLADQPDAGQYDDERVRQVLADVFSAMANNEVESIQEPEPEIQPLPQTEGIEQQLKNAPLQAERKPAEVKPAENNQSETESSGEAPAESKVEEKSS